MMVIGAATANTAASTVATIARISSRVVAAGVRHGQAVLREERDHPAAHEHQDDHHDPQHSPRDRRSRVNHPGRIQVQRQVRQGEQDQHDGEDDIAPVLRRYQRPQHGHRRQRQEGDIDHRDHLPGKVGARQHERTPRYPQDRQPGKRCAGNRRASRPVGDRRQKEPDQNRRGEAKQHLMRVPGKRAEPGGQRQMPVPDGDP
jgi:hypothetical protein